MTVGLKLLNTLSVMKRIIKLTRSGNYPRSRRPYMIKVR
jgi:hypothetical protein